VKDEIAGPKLRAELDRIHLRQNAQELAISMIGKFVAADDKRFVPWVRENVEALRNNLESMPEEAATTKKRMLEAYEHILQMLTPPT
jgi:hypothetical protein